MRRRRSAISQCVLKDCCTDFSASLRRNPPTQPLRLRPKLTTLASSIGYDLDRRTDIAWTFSFQVRLLEKRGRPRRHPRTLLVLKHKLEDTDAAQRLARQIVGKLDLGIASVDEQLKALEGFHPRSSDTRDGPNVITKTDGYNLLSVEPLQTLFASLIDTVQAPQMKRSLAALSGLVEATGLGTRTSTCASTP